PARPSGLGGAGLDVGDQALAQKASGMERMHVEAVAELAGEPRDVGIHAGDEDRHFWMFDRARAEEGRHQRVLVEFALEIELRAVLPAIPDRPQREDDLAEPLPRGFPFYAEAPLVVAFHLRAEAEDEAAARICLEVPSGVGEHHGAPREGER